MSINMSTIIRVSEQALDRERARQDQLLRDRFNAVFVQKASDSHDILASFTLGQAYRLVFVRCHFTGAGGTNPFRVYLSSSLSKEFDALIDEVAAGENKDVFLHNYAGPVDQPSPFAFGMDDKIAVSWTNPNPGALKWGLTVGLALTHAAVYNG